MPESALNRPETDPTPIFEAFRGSYGSELLTAAVSHLGVFEKLSPLGAFTLEQVGNVLGLESRPTTVLITALRAMKLIEAGEDGLLQLTRLSREHLIAGAEFDVSAYLGLAAQAPGVIEMVQRLRTNRPAGAESKDQGAAFIYREGLESAMERESSARSLTLALAGRARNVALYLAQVANLENAKVLLDVGGGTGIYAIACLQKYPNLKAIVWDRPEVLKVAHEMAEAHGVADRLQLAPGDMFVDPVPPGADTILLSNILHDWDVPECHQLVTKLASTLPPRGQLLIHDVFLNDAMDGPLPIALYSAALFTLTEGRAYSAAEFRSMLEAAGLETGSVMPTLVHCGILGGKKPSAA
jgi:predicted O-methyltransferase YrrM